MRIISNQDTDIRLAAEALSKGGLVAFPTETVYGLGGDAFNPKALARIFEVKRRPHFDPLIVHIASRESLGRIADISLLHSAAREKLALLLENLWPGPLTLILPKRPEVPELATSGLPTVAVRFPSHPVARELIRLSTGAVAAPSANPFGYLSPTQAAHVAAQLGEDVDYIVDGGRTTVGLESTVLDLCSPEPRILRPGGTPREEIEKVIGKTADSPAAHILSPGQLKSHYAPRTPLYLYEHNDMELLPYNPSEAFVFFSGRNRDAYLKTHKLNAVPDTRALSSINVLSETGSLLEAAANLFETLHKLDRGNFSAIRAEKVPPLGLGAAVNDRLSKARFDAQ